MIVYSTAVGPLSLSLLVCYDATKRASYSLAGGSSRWSSEINEQRV